MACSSPPASLPGDGGAYVANSTELIHLKDTKGTGKADERRVRALRLRHRRHAPHHSHVSLGARTACCTSINRSTSTATSKRRYGVRRFDGGGIWQFRPETIELDVFAARLVQSVGPRLRSLGPIVRHRRRRRRRDQLRPARRDVRLHAPARPVSCPA